jgi:hypothetical protein
MVNVETAQKPKVSAELYSFSQWQMFWRAEVVKSFNVLKAAAKRSKRSLSHTPLLILYNLKAL